MPRIANRLDQRWTHRSALFLAGPLLALCVGAGPATAAKPTSGSSQDVPGANLIRTATTTGSELPFLHHCDLPGADVRLESTGRGRIRSREGSESRFVLFVVPEGKIRFVGRLWCGVVDQGVVLVTGEEFGDGTANYVSLVDTKSGRVVWRTSANAMIGELLLTRSALYLSGYHFIGKLDIQTGKLLWSHRFKGSRLADALHSFQEPVSSGGTIRFPVDHSDRSRSIQVWWPSAIVVDDETGRIREPADLQ